MRERKALSPLDRKGTTFSGITGDQGPVLAENSIRPSFPFGRRVTPLHFLAQVPARMETRPRNQARALGSPGGPGHRSTRRGGNVSSALLVLVRVVVATVLPAPYIRFMSTVSLEVFADYV